VSLSQLADLLFRYKGLASFLFVSCFLVSCLIYLFIPARYEAEALLLVGQGLNSRSADAAGESKNALSSLATIALTDEVIGRAATKIGLSRLFGDELDRQTSTTESFDVFDATTKRSTSVAYHSISKLRTAVTVKADEKSDLLRLSFRFSAPDVAADFVNALVGSLMSKQADLVSRPGAVGFFEGQKARLEGDIQKASEDLAQFATTTSTYAIDEQRQLLLKRASDLASSLASTQGAIAERNGRRQAVAEQLRKLKPVSQSPFVSQLVDTFGGASPESNSRPANSATPDRTVSTDPPLLLVKVYQDGMADLMKINAEITGYSKLESSINDQIKKVNLELNALADKEAKYEHLKRNVSIASSSAEFFGKRVLEEEINTNLAAAQISSVRIVQRATRPVEPVFPKLLATLLLGGIGGIVVSIGAVLAFDAFFRSVPSFSANLHDDSDIELALSNFARRSLKPDVETAVDGTVRWRTSACASPRPLKSTA
jgi:polysaccharide biosynthesis transport protein